MLQARGILGGGFRVGFQKDRLALFDQLDGGKRVEGDFPRI